jgi:diguanylate cyclase
MSKIAPEQLATEWAAMLDAHPQTVRQHLQAVAAEHQNTLATHFYEHMLAEPVAAQFLSHDQVRSRLHHSMQRWVVSIFSAHDRASLLPVIAQQVQIGEIHARIDVPMHLVLRGARQLKLRLAQQLREDRHLELALRSEAVHLADQVIDAAMEIMSQAYASSHDRNSRAAEAYRLFAVSQNVGAERERQRAALLAWENQLMFEQAVGTDPTQLPRLGSSEFGLWFRHKGAHAFQGTTETSLILEAIDRIDDVLLPMFGLAERQSREDTVQLLRDFRDLARGIGFHLDALFEQNNELESGRDVLTRLLNRKFLPVVLGKEVQFSRQRKSGFALLAVDIDHFKRVNDTHGHEAGDMVLQQVAGRIQI